VDLEGRYLNKGRRRGDYCLKGGRGAVEEQKALN